MTTIVKPAAPHDEREIVDLLRVKHIEDGLGKFDEEKVRLTVQRGLARDFSVIGVIRGKEVIEASVGLYITEPWDARDQILSDLWCYGAEPYRKSTHAKHLLEFAKWAARELEKPLMISCVTNEATARKESFFARHLPRGGSFFIFKPDKAAA